MDQQPLNKKDSMDTILNSLGIAVLVINEDKTVIFKNHASRKRFRRGTTGSNLSTVVNDEILIDAVDQVLSGKKYLSIDIPFQEVVPMLFRVNIARLEPTKKHNYLRAVISFEDISHIREAEQMRSDFVANVSHELRSPLTALYGFIETLREDAGQDIEMQAKFLDMMAGESRRMARLIDDLLSLSKLQAVEREAPDSKVSIGPILERVAAMLEPLAQQEGTKIVPYQGHDLPKVFGEDDKLIQVFQNLIENAIKYSPAGTKVLINVDMDPENQSMLIVRITDSGYGIDASHIPRLTERFYRVDKGRSRNKGGTGLGLAIVKHILVQHRGWLKIESTPGSGSTFSVALPIA